MTIVRYSLDKNAPGMFAKTSGGWIKYSDYKDKIRHSIYEIEKFLDDRDGSTAELQILVSKLKAEIDYE